MKSTDVVNVVITVAILVLIVSRQLRAQPAKINTPLVLILGVIGIVETVAFLAQRGHGGGRAYAGLLGSLALAVVLGGIRAYTMRVWVDGGQIWRQGNWLTAGLWIVSLGVHFGYDYLVDGKGADSGLGAATALLYFAVTYTVQRYVVLARGQRMLTT